MSVQVKLDIFEGPFDLLLYLIRKNEIDIYDIPIAEITHQYLEYIRLMQMMDLEIAGEYIEMVAILLLIKTRTLIPSEETEEEVPEEDPRRLLAMQLIEYARFKEAGLEMSEMENRHRLEIPHTPLHVALPTDKENDIGEYLDNVTFFDLLSAFKVALDNQPKEILHEVKRVKVTTEQQSRFVLNKLKSGKPLLFNELLKGVKEKVVIIVTFMAILDLIRLKLIQVTQSQPYQNFQVRTIPDDPINAFENIVKMRTGISNEERPEETN